MAETQSNQQGGGTPLQSDRGTTTINDAVVVSIASQVVQEVSGAESQVATGRGGGSIPGDNSSTMGELFGRVTGSSRGTRGVSVEVGETQAAVDLTITVPCGQSIPEIIQRMRDGVIQRVESLTGLQVTEVNITVKDIFFPNQQQQ